MRATTQRRNAQRQARVPRVGGPQWKAELVAQRPKTAKLVCDERLREYVQQRLAGEVRLPDGTASGARDESVLGRNKPRRHDRRWGSAWSPQQISERLKLDFPDDRSMRISHEAIYQALYVQSRGALKRELDMQSGRRVAGTLGACAALRVGRSRPRAPEPAAPITMALGDGVGGAWKATGHADDGNGGVVAHAWGR